MVIRGKKVKMLCEIVGMFGIFFWSRVSNRFDNFVAEEFCCEAPMALGGGSPHTTIQNIIFQLYSAKIKFFSLS